MRPALSFVLLCCLALVARAQLPAEGKTFYSKDSKILIPFRLEAKGGPATSVKLFYSLDGGAWQEYETLRAGAKREFLFKADREGQYSFATMTLFSDGTSDPPSKDKLYEQNRVVYDHTPPRFVSVRSVLSSEGAPGIEWDITDDNMENRGGVKLEFRWPEMGRFEPIDRNVPFGARDLRHWQIKAGDRMQVRVVATDKAGNRAESEAVWISTKEAERGGGGDLRLPDSVREGPNRPLTNPTSDPRTNNDISPAAGLKTAQPSLHYINTKKVVLNSDITVGQSGLTGAALYVADEKLEWSKPAKEEGPRAAPGATTADQKRVIPLKFEHTVEKDGLYNFIIIVKNHRGQNRPDPKKGTPGEVQIVVDTTMPQVEFIGKPKVSSNGDRGAVVDIRWKATDANIAPIPIQLEYAPAGGGGKPQEWKSITPDWVDNTGQFNWIAPTGESHEFQVRVRCKDRAGNIGQAVTAEAINVDLAVPSVEIKDIGPGTGAAPMGTGIRITPGM